MVYGIIKQHLGFIDVYSELGEGDAFKIYLPLIASEHETRRTSSSVPEDKLQGGPETVLIARG